MPAYSSREYGRMAKAGFLLGLAMIVVGASGEWAVHSHVLSLPAWETAVLFDMEVLGVLLLLLSPFVFGIALPLIDG